LRPYKRYTLHHFQTLNAQLCEGDGETEQKKIMKNLSKKRIKADTKNIGEAGQDKKN